MIADSTVSSTVIRQSLREGNIDLVNRLLGYAYYFDGLVVRGDQRGRTIGFPTANLSLRQEEKMLPANGVYAVEVTLAGHNKKLPGMMNIGFRPTVDGSKKTIEVHIFDFEEDIYGRVLQVTVLRRIRPEQKFSGIEELRDQLEKDRINVKDGV